MSWKANPWPSFEESFAALDDETQERLVAAIEVLEESGPWVDLPFVWSVPGLPGLCELRMADDDIVALFRFEHDRGSVELIAVAATRRDAQRLLTIQVFASPAYDDALGLPSNGPVQ